MMRTMWMILLAALVPGAAMADALPAAPHLVVHGHAERQVRPDLFEVDIEVSRLGTSVPEITRTVETQAGEIVAQMRAAGLKDTEITATNLRIQAQFEYDEEARRRVFTGNEASRQISARFGTLAGLHAFLARVPAGETVQVGGVRTGLASEAAIKEQLLDEAVADSKRAAASLASRYGQTIIGVYSISDRPPPVPAYGLDRVAVTGARIQQALSEGVVDVSRDVYVVFLIGKE